MSDFESPYEKEAEERWGHTDAWKESRRRTASYTPEQVREIKAELEDIEAALAGLMDDGAAADGEEARAAAERARLHIDRWYYPCPPEMHVGLAEMYVADPRFRAHYDDRRAGLADYVAAAIRANAAEATS